jgi:hypothetical protein
MRQRRRDLPYRSRAERERAQWQMLPEVIALVCAVDGCDQKAARHQLSKILADGALWPLRWDNMQPPLGFCGGLTVPDDLPPRRWGAAEIAEIDWELGTALDRSEFSPPEGRRRRLLIHRLALRPYWTDTAQSNTATPRDAANAELQPLAVPSPGIRTNRAASAEDACRNYLSQLNPNQRPKNKDAAFEGAKVAVADVGILSRKAFERAWASSTPLAWLKAGRRKKAATF